MYTLPYKFFSCNCKVNQERHCLDERYSTTRRLICYDARYAWQSDAASATGVNGPGIISKTMEGGLRTRGYFKAALPDKPLISVVTAVLNNQQFLRESVLSVINQTYDNLEYIIIDGGSADGTLGIIADYDEVIDYWLSEPDSGIYDAMNKGISLAAGDWVLILNSDDYLLDETVLERMVLFLNKFIEVDMVYGGALMRFEEESFCEKIATKLTEENLRKARLPPHMATLVKRQAVVNLNLYDTTYSLAADFDFYIRFLRAGYKARMVDLNLAAYRIHDTQRSIYRLHGFWKETNDIIFSHFGWLSGAMYFIRRVFMVGLRVTLIKCGLFQLYRRARGAFTRV